jgi:hypothetical protein
MTMDRDLATPRAEIEIVDVLVNEDRAASARALEAAQRNPILSAEQSCAVAQVHALLAIERRLAQLLAALVDSGDHSVARLAVAARS